MADKSLEQGRKIQINHFDQMKNQFWIDGMVNEEKGAFCKYCMPKWEIKFQV